MSQSTKKTTKKSTETTSKKKEKKETRRPNGTFDKGNTIGKETRFAVGDKAACKYKPEYCEQLIEYFSQPLTRMEFKETYYKGEVASRTPMIFPNEYPTFQGFAAKIGVLLETLINWSKEYPQFRDSYARAKEMQYDKLTSGAMIGQYNPLYAKFEAVNNHGMKEKQEVNVGGSLKVPQIDDKDLELIRRVEERLKNAKKN